MSKKQVYKTVAAESETLLVEKKSKFISHIKPVDNEPDALSYLSHIRSLYPDARHNVYAYVIDENNIFRYSDDGEPSGTAGMPVLDTIRKSGIVDVVAVITRYFGGTLLGTGGLVRAYSASAKQGLIKSRIIIRTLCDIISARISYDLVGKLQYSLAADGFAIENTVYENDVTFFISAPKSETARLMARIIDITGGRAELKITDSKYIDKEEEQNGDQFNKE